MVGRRERKKEERRTRIRQAARELFREQGFDATTTRAIADRADVGAGTLFTYFRDKVELLQEVFLADLEEVAVEALARARDVARRDASFVEQMCGCFGRCFEYYARDEELSRILVKNAMFVRGAELDEMNASAFRFVQGIADLVEEAQARGEVRVDVVPFSAAMTIFGNYYFILSGWLGGALVGEGFRDHALRGTLELIFRGMAPSNGG